MSSSNIYIKVTDLQKTFLTSDGEITILKGLNFEIKKGEFNIIFGPSGCGKSTLLHTMLGLEVPSKGKVIMDGNDLYSMTEDERAIFRRHNVGMIYQQPLWVASLNVFENIAFALHLLNLETSDIEKKTHDVLKLVGMDDHAFFRPTELSSGQQQKISLARALVRNPDIIVADEPTGNLDTMSGQDLINTFMDVHSKGITIIMVTHDLEYLKYANTIIHMIDGQIVETFNPKSKKLKFSGKKFAAHGSTDVRDSNFLKKLHL